MRPRVLALVAVLALIGTGCVAPGASTEDDAPGGLQQPTFTPLATTPEAVTTPAPGTTEDPVDPTAVPSPTIASPSSVPAPAATGSSPPPEPSPTASPTTAPDPTPEPTADPPALQARGTLPDDIGDLQGLGAARAPDHADLRHLTLEVADDTGQIQVAFAGPAPETGDGDTILNVATYHDVTGDGEVDYEIWASLTSDGWGTSWFGIREGTARFAAEDDVEVEVVDGVLVLTFPASHLGGARSGRWLASSEWGTAVDMSAGTSTTDDAPDDRTGRAWPS